MYSNRLTKALVHIFKKRSRQANNLSNPFHFVTKIPEMRDFFQVRGLSDDALPEQSGRLSGHCYTCDLDVFFEVDRPRDGSPVNWRETLKCPTCGMINRWRACIHLFDEVCQPGKQSRIYITEALSPVAKFLKSRNPAVATSEYLEGFAPGEIVKVRWRSIRNEDVTRLSFRDGSFDTVLSFDVLEHVPAYRTALEEFYRVLDNGGRLIVTAPFTFLQASVTRAKRDADGQVHHLMEPCYHGDPMSDKGVLAYYDFGLELLDELREIGFADNSLAVWNAQEWGYAGENMAFVSRKAR